MIIDLQSIWQDYIYIYYLVFVHIFRKAYDECKHEFEKSKLHTIENKNVNIETDKIVENIETDKIVENIETDRTVETFEIDHNKQLLEDELLAISDIDCSLSVINLDFSLNDSSNEIVIDNCDENKITNDIQSVDEEENENQAQAKDEDIVCDVSGLCCNYDCSGITDLTENNQKMGFELSGPELIDTLPLSGFDIMSCLNISKCENSVTQLNTVVTMVDDISYCNNDLDVSTNCMGCIDLSSNHVVSDNQIKLNNDDMLNKLLMKYQADIGFIDKLKTIFEKKKRRLHRLRGVPVKYEEFLERFCMSKRELANRNMWDWKFEKTLTYEINDPYLFVLENSFSNKECDEMVRQFEDEHFIHYNGCTGGGYMPNTKRTTEINLTRTQSWKKWNQICFERLNYALQKYAVHCVEKCHNETLLNILKGNGKINDTGYQLQKYMKEQQYYKWHQDGGLKQCLCEHRIITYLWYLNDVDEGGETYFFHGKIKPKKGNLVLFPATWIYNHKGETPISHDKYIITGWVYSNV